MTRLPSLATLSLPRLRTIGDQQAMDAADEESTLAAVGRTGLSGLGYVGGVLSKLFGGRAIRGALGGRPRELLSILPGSDTFGLTDPNEEVGGRQLLEQYGMLGQNTPGLDFGDVAGFAADTLLDPGSYLTFGGSALGRGGQVLRRAGVLDDALRSVRAARNIGPRMARGTTAVGDVLASLPPDSPDLLNAVAKAGYNNLDEFKLAHGAEKVGGSVGIGLPFMRPSFTMQSDRLAGVLDKTGDVLKYGNPLGRTVNSLFNAKAGGATSDLGQKAFENVLTPSLEKAKRSIREVEMRHVAKAFDEGMLGDAGRRDIWSALEQPTQAAQHAAGAATGQPMFITKKMEAGLKAAGYSGDDIYKMTPVDAWQKLGGNAKADQAAADIANDWKAIHADQQLRKRALHVPASDLQDPAMEAGAAPARYSVYKPGAGMGKSRLDHLVGIPDSTNTIRDVVLDPHVQAAVQNKASVKKLAQLIKTKFGDRIPELYEIREPVQAKRTLAGAREFADLGKTGSFDVSQATAEAVTGIKQQPKLGNRYVAMAQHLKTLKQEALDAGLYGHHPVLDQAFRASNTEEFLSKVSVAYDILKKPAAYTVDPAGVPITQILKKGRNGGMGVILGSKKAPGALNDIAAALGVTREVAGKMKVRPDVAADILSKFPGRTAKTAPALGAVGKFMDSFLNLWKAGQTGPWPAFITRNLTGGQIENWTRNLWSADSVWHTGKMLAGKDTDYFTSIPLIQQIAKKRGLPLDSKVATNIARELANVYDISGRYVGEVGARVGAGAAEPLGDLGAKLADFPGGLGGSQPHSLTGTLKTAIGRGEGTLGQKFNPLNVRGVGGRTESTFAPVVAGEQAGAWVEGMNRLPPFFHQLKEGVAPAEAASRVKATQVAYDAASYTDFERKYLTRLLPFYKYLKSKTIDTARDIITRPGGKQAIMVKGLSRGVSPNEFLPPDIAQGAAIRGGALGLGDTDAEGNPRYVTNLGLMNEQPLSILGGGPWNLLQQVGGGLNPIAKLPIESLTGKSLFRSTPMGLKNLDDLDPLLGRIASNVSGEDTPMQFPTALERLAGASPAARTLTTLRTLTDPRKRSSLGLPGGAALVNTLTGLRVTDVSPSAKDAVQREEIGALLKSNPLVHEFSNIYVSPEDMDKLTPEDRKLLALLRLQAQRKRQAKKAG